MLTSKKLAAKNNCEPRLFDKAQQIHFSCRDLEITL
jgi:hypothetical protein